MKNTFSILILEDDLETVELILSTLRQIESIKEVSFKATVIPDYIQVENMINKNNQTNFDILLLDRDCYLGGSFHVVNLDFFNLNKAISISSVPSYNREAKARGINRSVLKDYANLKDFSIRLKEELLKII